MFRGASENFVDVDILNQMSGRQNPINFHKMRQQLLISENGFNLSIHEKKNSIPNHKSLWLHVAFFNMCHSFKHESVYVLKVHRV